MAKKDSFILYTDQKAVMDKLSDEQAGKLIKAIYEYVENGEMPELDSVLDLVITPFKTVLDKDKAKYEEVSKARAEAGSKGGKTKESKGKQNKQLQTKENKTSNCDDNDNENDNDNEDDNDLLSNKEVDELQKTIIETLGSTNLTVIQEAISYLDDFPLEVIKEALIRTARKQKRWDYARGTLNNWLKDGLNTIDKIKANDLQFETKKEVKEETEEEKIARKIKELEGS